MVQRCQNHRKTIEVNGGLKKNINHSIALKNWPSSWSSLDDINCSHIKWLIEKMIRFQCLVSLMLSSQTKDEVIAVGRGKSLFHHHFVSLCGGAAVTFSLHQYFIWYKLWWFVIVIVLSRWTSLLWRGWRSTGWPSRTCSTPPRRSWASWSSPLGSGGGRHSELEVGDFTFFTILQVHLGGGRSSQGPVWGRYSWHSRGSLQAERGWFGDKKTLIFAIALPGGAKDGALVHECCMGQADRHWSGCPCAQVARKIIHLPDTESGSVDDSAGQRIARSLSRPGRHWRLGFHRTGGKNLFLEKKVFSTGGFIIKKVGWD